MAPAAPRPWWAPIDWTRPWFAPYRHRGEAVIARLAAGEPLAAALNATAPPIALAAGPLRFVPIDALPPGTSYEAFIARTACVPTRDNLHDLFNALVWLRFPAWKRQLNSLQADAIARAGVAATRGRLRDALTLFDESGALFDAPADLATALRQRDWTALCVAARAQWRPWDQPAGDRPGARFVVFGHAVLEKLARGPYKAITAQVWLGDGARLPTANGMAAWPRFPLPVLGVPGWWPANDDPAFYGDAAVFRPLPQPSLGRNPSIEK